jgi:hypothetical protein
MNEDMALLLRALEEQNRTLRAVLAVLVDQALRANSELADSKFPSMDSLLSDAAGLKNVEIGQLLGKSPQAVGQVIAKKAKS